MSNFNDPNDPNYVTPGTAEPVREYVVRETETVRRVAPVQVEVEPERPSLRWLWWLLGLLALAALAWALTRACRPHEACTTLNDTVWNTTSTAALNKVEEWIPGVDHGQATTALRTLCNQRLAGTTGWAGGIGNAFSFAGTLETSVINHIEELVSGNTFCRCS